MITFTLPSSRLVYGLFLFVTQFTLPVLARYSGTFGRLYHPCSGVAYLKIINKLSQRGEGIVSQSRPIAKLAALIVTLTTPSPGGEQREQGTDAGAESS